MLDAPQFTVVIPTCNRPALLDRAIASALAQSDPSSQIIVVDDASDPETLASYRYAGASSRYAGRVQFVASPIRLGPGGARNLGVAHARGDWIAFLDDDDEFHPDFIAATKARLKSEPDRRFSWSSAKLVGYDAQGQAASIVEHRFKADYDSEGELLAQAVSIGAGYGFTVDRATFQRLGGFDVSYKAIEDTEFFFRLIAAGCRPAVVAEPMMRIHLHNGPKMTAVSSHLRRIEECERLARAQARLIEQYPSLRAYLDYTIAVLSRSQVP